MKAIKCKECNASIPWDGVSVRLECPYCGTVYERQTNRGANEQKHYIDKMGNECLIGYYPPSFHGSFQERDQGNSLHLPCIEKPIKVYYEMSSSDGNAHILFITGSVYHHIEDIPQNRGRQNTLGSDLKRYRSFVGASAYSDIRFTEEHPSAENVRILMTEQPRKEVQETLVRMSRQYMQNAMGAVYQNEFVGKVYGYTENGTSQVCVVRMALEWVEKPSFTMPMNSLFGGLFGMNQRPPSKKDLTWSVCNEIYFWGTEQGVDRYWADFEKVYETIKTAPAYHQAEQMVFQSFNQANQQMADNAVRMAQAQMESSQRIGNMINDTYAYGMDLDRQSFANSSAMMDRVNTMRSEAIRGVNRYSDGEGGFVEADVRFDQVYRNNTYSDVYAASEGDLDLGSDWTVLKKR